ncbi:MAG: hypothetical protein DHS20C12_15380 [Pseudohongiella sp.]|nr:MAG: hypothetical protein DHS20C12_15380 [Pseudohongiella sp.]
MKAEHNSSTVALDDGLRRILPWAAVAVCLSVAGAFPAQAQLQDETPAFESFESQEALDSAEDELREEQERAREVELTRELNLRLQAIDEMQGSEGIYSPQLQEAYADLAALYVEMEDFESALLVYADALQISRINSGLYSDEQLPLITAMIDSNSQLRNWEETDNLQELRYHISSRLYSLDNLAYLEAAENYAAWKLRLLRQNLMDLGYRAYSNSAEDLSDFYERLLENLALHSNTRQENLIGIYQGKSQADLVLARAIANTPYTAFQGSASRYLNQQRCRNVRNSAGQIVRECVSVQVENPRYRQSQRDAKQFAMSRATREVQESIDGLQQILAQSSDLAQVERDELEANIAELETEAYQLLRQSRSRRLF